MNTIISILFAKDVFVFMDGTWNNETSNTNIYKMFKHYPGKIERNTYTSSFNVSSFIKRQQQTGDIAIYVRGLGTGTDKTYNLVEGLTGYGLEGWVAVAYDFLTKELTQKDSLRIFGFSRGATSARVLAHYLNGYGIAKINIQTGKIQATLLEPNVASVKGWIPQVTFLGLFDSVRAVSTAQGTMSVLKKQIKLKKRNIFSDLWDKVSNKTATATAKAREKWAKWNIIFRPRKLIKYTDVLGENVVKCSHAVAINEYRTMYNYSTIDLDNPKFTQRYFIGSHSDIGGSAIQNRSAIALSWMLNQGKLSNFFPNILPIGYNGTKHALEYPIKDSYTEPTTTQTIDTKTEKFLFPVFYRTLLRFPELVDPSVAPIAKFLHISLADTANRNKIRSLLRLKRDYLSGNTSITNVTFANNTQSKGNRKH